MASIKKIRVRLFGSTRDSLDQEISILFDLWEKKLILGHDFVITQRFIIFSDNQIIIRPEELTKGQVPLGCDANKTARSCLLPKNDLREESASTPQWFEAPGVNCLHYLNFLGRRCWWSCAYHIRGLPCGKDSRNPPRHHFWLVGDSVQHEHG